MPKTTKTKTPRAPLPPAPSRGAGGGEAAADPATPAPSTIARGADIAVVGLSALFPGSVDETGFWHDILSGRDLIRDVPPTHWLKDDYFDADPTKQDKTYATRGAFLDAVDFDALGFGVPPNVVPATDTAQLLSLIVAQRVLDEVSAASPARKVAKDRISVILGVTSGQELLSSMASRLQRPVWVKALREAGLPESKVQEACDRISSHYVPWQENTFPGLLGNVVAGRIANRFDTGGTNCVTDAACASSFAATSMAVNELVLGQSDLVVTGGVDTLNDIFMYMCFAKTQALSKAGDCRPFSDEADGTLLGEGLAMLALKRLADAERDGDRIYAVLRGVGSSSDGRAKSVYAPRPEGQAKAIARAYQAAGYGPETVELVEAHGTGTKAGDVAEFEGLRLAFDESQRADRQWCALGSVKSQIGHTKAAAGAAGLFKSVMALVHGALPPTIKIARPNPKLELEKSPFYLNTAARPWVRGSDHPRRVGVSSFGFGGSNFHLTLEEYRGPGKRALRKRTAAAELLVFGAATADGLVQALSALPIGGPGSLQHLARSTQQSCPRDAAVRLALLATDEKDLAAKIATAVKTLQARPTQPLSAPGVHFSPAAQDGKLAFLFPGQGSQYVGMGGSLAIGWREALSAWDLAADVVHDGTIGLQHVVFPRPAFTDEERAAQSKRLQATDWAQPAIGAASLAQLKLLSAIGVRPDALAGHSFGEVTALYAAGAFDETTLLQIARRRGELMAEAAQVPGAMTAALAPLPEVQAALAEAPEARVANYNAPAQTVVCGTVDAVERAEAAFAKHGIRFQRLDVATAFHSPIVAASQKPFEAFLKGAEIGRPGLPVFSNSEAAPYPTEPGAVRSLLASQLARPVRFVESIEAMYAAGVRTFVEVGPGSTLTGLVERILAGRPFTAVSLDVKGKDGVAAFHEGLAKLFAAGCAMDLAPLWADFQPTIDPRAVKKPAVSIPICGANYGKPYPPAKGAAALPPPNPEMPSKSVESRQSTLTPNPSPASGEGGLNPGWLEAYQQAQRDTLEAHTAWQKAMTETHTAYLKAVERSFEAVAAAAAGAPLPAATAAPVAFQAPALSAMPAPAPVPVPVAAPVASPVVAAPAPATPSPAQVDLKALLLEVVSAKTGYPAEMLNVDLSLEADLGIDSIKRVEILSALRERVPELPEVKPAAMASLKTLGAIIDFAQSNRPATAAAPSAPSTSSSPSTPSKPAATDLKALLLEIVSAKTGYPGEMLGMDLSLEADLGIDSIKRVEILSAMRERVPDLPEVKPAAMAGLKTLGSIVAFLDGGAAGRAEAPVTGQAGTPAAPKKQNGSTAHEAPSPVLAKTLERCVVRAIERPAPGLGMPGLSQVRRLAIVPSKNDLAKALQAALRARGIGVSLEASVPPDADGVVFVGGLSDAPAGEVVRAAFRAARDAAAQLSDQPGLFVTVQDTGGDFGLSGSERAALGGIAGIAKTASMEWPKASVKALDVERGARTPQAIATAIVQELLEGGADREVGLSASGRRVVPVTAPEPVGEPAAAPPLDASAVVVATGGARGVTAACLIALARRTHARFLLLGRTALTDEPACCRGAQDDAAVKRALLADAKASGRTLSPAELSRAAGAVLAAREARGTLEAIQAAGGQARYAAADTRDRAALDSALLEARRWGPITAVVHGAGVLADKRLAEKTDEAFDSVFDTKVQGLDALLAATASDPLKAVCLFSSVAARTGNAGQADYAAANEVLNKRAALESRLRGESCRVVSIGWGPWDGGMVDAGLRARFAALGVPLIPLAAGAEAFADELLSGKRDREIILGGLPPVPTGDGVRFDVSISQASHPQLADHAIDDVPVLPFVQVLEYFARAAHAVAPDSTMVSCRDVKLLRGVKLDRFTDGGTWLSVVGQRASPETLKLELRGRDGTLHYAATADLSPRPNQAHPPPPPPALTERFAKAIYDGTELFHGPRFQVVRDVEGVSAEGIVGTLTGTRERGWQGAWQTDAAALDGGLQLALLWSGHVMGGRSLPTCIGEVRTYQPGTAAGPLRCTLRGHKVGDSHATSDIALVDKDGALVCEMRGVETIRRPDSAQGS